jgi:hypothetical protein
MTSFEATLDDAFDELEAKLGRPPNSDEEGELRERLFQSWLKSKRFDELIEYVHDYHELEGGFGDSSIISEALRKEGDLSRIERLFGGLLKSRKKAFARVWAQAQEGHIGAMWDSAKFAAAIMEAYAGLYHGYWSLENEAGKDRVKGEMLHFQAHRRDKPASRSRRSDA